MKKLLTVIVTVEVVCAIAILVGIFWIGISKLAG